jgi:hypothetical protein
MSRIAYQPNTTEQHNVLDVYETIAHNFSNTRRTVWDGVKVFLDSQEPGSIGFEAGMGNGKNMLYRDDLVMKGIDTCQNFVDRCLSFGLNVENCNILNYIDELGKYDFAISIAVFHHLSCDLNRFCAMYNLISIIKPGGKGLVTVWSVEQDIDSKKHFKKGDNYVIWHKPRIIEDGSQVYDKYNRYYYVFDKKDFYEYINKFKALIDINKIYNEKGNWFCIFTKKIYD